MRHVEDDSTIMWAIGPDSSAIAKHAKFCGDEVEMVVPIWKDQLSRGTVFTRGIVDDKQLPQKLVKNKYIFIDSRCDVPLLSVTNHHMVIFKKENTHTYILIGREVWS